VRGIGDKDAGGAAGTESDNGGVRFDAFVGGVHRGYGRLRLARSPICLVDPRKIVASCGRTCRTIAVATAVTEKIGQNVAELLIAEMHAGMGDGKLCRDHSCTKKHDPRFHVKV